MHALVTGAAGFIGSHLCERLLAAGDRVRAVDAFTDNYDPVRKEENLSRLLGQDGFTFVDGDLSELTLRPLLDGIDAVYHLAGQPGVRSSWGSDFAVYVERNIHVTQRLLEACRLSPPTKLVYASSSSIYGDVEAYPLSETTCPHPVSPYGVTKLAAEQLCEVYRLNFGIQSAVLRLFTVYGPRQRPDIAFSRLVACALGGERFELYGDGEQTRDCTFVGDVTRAMRDAATSDWVGVASIGSGSKVSMNAVVALVSSMCGPFELTGRPRSAGDMRSTEADIRVAAAAFGYEPQTTLSDGLQAMVDWERSRTVAA
jgi:nucleoside-diphosphate-sugar epimerase